jgi:hypothetical protein
MKITQPVFVQIFSDEFFINKDNRIATAGVPGQILRKGDCDIGPDAQFHYRKGTGNLIRMEKWSRPDVISATRDLARFMGEPNSTHLKALERYMEARE